MTLLVETLKEVGKCPNCPACKSNAHTALELAEIIAAEKTEAERWLTEPTDPNGL